MMTKAILGLFMTAMIFSTMSFAQTDATQSSIKALQTVSPTQLPGWLDWMALMKKQRLERKALNDRLKSERDAFFKNHPEIAARVEEQMKKAKESAEKRKAQMQAQK